MWVLIIFGVLLIGIGLCVHVFKWYFLISGYNTMSKEKKANVDIKGLSRMLGIYAYINGSLFILAGLVQPLGLNLLIRLIVIFFVISTIYLLIRAQKFDKNIFDENGKIRKNGWKQMAIPIGIVVASLIIVAVLMHFSLKPTKITYLEEGIQIHGMYGDVYGWESIEVVELIDELPTIELRTNGAAIGSKLKGYFRTKELGTVKLFVDADKAPFIQLETVNGIIIFNLNEENETKEIYRNILSEIKSNNLSYKR